MKNIDSTERFCERWLASGLEATEFQLNLGCPSKDVISKVRHSLAPLAVCLSLYMQASFLFLPPSLSPCPSLSFLCDQLLLFF